MLANYIFFKLAVYVLFNVKLHVWGDNSNGCEENIWHNNWYRKTEHSCFIFYFIYLLTTYLFTSMSPHKFATGFIFVT